MGAALGVIGLGNMGGMLAGQFLELGLVAEGELHVSNRSAEKCAAFRERHPAVRVCRDNAEVARACRQIIICVEPANVPGVLAEIRPQLGEESYLMISTATVAYEDLYRIYRGKITKFMPTLNSTVRGGVTLACHNELVAESDRAFFTGLLAAISEVKVIREEDMNLCHNLTGSLPAIVAEIMQEFVRAAARKSTGVTEAEIERMVMVSLAGAARLFVEKNMRFEETIRRVSTKGGITFEGIQVYQRTLPGVFDEAFAVTMRKYAEITARGKAKVEELVK